MSIKLRSEYFGVETQQVDSVYIPSYGFNFLSIVVLNMSTESESLYLVEEAIVTCVWGQ